MLQAIAPSAKGVDQVPVPQVASLGWAVGGLLISAAAVGLGVICWDVSVRDWISMSNIRFWRLLAVACVVAALTALILTTVILHQ